MKPNRAASFCWKSILLIKLWLDYLESFRTILRLLLFLRNFHSSHRDKAKTLKCSSGVNNLTNHCYRMQSCTNLLTQPIKSQTPKNPSLSSFTFHAQEQQSAGHQTNQKQIYCASFCPRNEGFAVESPSTAVHITLITSQFAFLVCFAEQWREET